MQLLSSIKNLITRCLTTGIANDSGDYQVQQIKYYGIPQNIQMVYPYGMNASAPVGSDVISWNIGGARENKAGIAQGSKIREKNLEETEVAFGNPVAGSKVVFKKNGDIEVYCPNNLNMTVNGETTLTCPETTIDGILNVTGALFIGGTVYSYDGSSQLNIETPIVSTEEITANSIALSTHVHGGVDAGPDDTGVPK